MVTRNNYPGATTSCLRWVYPFFSPEDVPVWAARVLGSAARMLPQFVERNCLPLALHFFRAPGFQRNSMLATALVVIAVLIAALVWCRRVGADQRDRADDGHARAARREENWYPRR